MIAVLTLLATLLALPVNADGDDMARFAGLARVACASGQLVYAAVLSQDLPDPMFENRWQLLLQPDGPEACLSPRRVGGVWVRTSATARGSYTIDVPGWGTVEVIPGSQELRAAFRNVAPASESRWNQVLKIRRYGDAIRFLIEERR